MNKYKDVELFLNSLKNNGEEISIKDIQQAIHMIAGEDKDLVFPLIKLVGVAAQRGVQLSRKSLNSLSDES